MKTPHDTPAWYEEYNFKATRSLVKNLFVITSARTFKRYAVNKHRFKSLVENFSVFIDQDRTYFRDLFESALF